MHGRQSGGSKKPSLKKREELLRLNKYLAKWGGFSRRESDRLIEKGEVFLNGKKVESPGIKVHIQKDRIRVQKRTIRASHSQKSLYFSFNKPTFVLTATKDPVGRPLVMDFFKKNKSRIFPVGRLDWDSEGLLLLTNDGDFAQKILHPKERTPKTYLVKVKGVFESRKRAKLLSGVPTPFGKKKALFAERVRKPSKKNAWIKIIIAEGKNRQLKLMLQSLGFQVMRLRRTAIGCLQLGALKKGEYRPLTEKDIKKTFLYPKELRRS